MLTTWYILFLDFHGQVTLYFDLRLELKLGLIENRFPPSIGNADLNGFRESPQKNDHPAARLKMPTAFSQNICSPHIQKYSVHHGGNRLNLPYLVGVELLYIRPS